MASLSSDLTQSINYSLLSPQPESAGAGIPTWEILTDHALISIFQNLPFVDLINCRLLNKRSVKVIDDDFWLLPNAFWHHTYKPFTSRVFSHKQYDNEIRSWLNNCNYNIEKTDTMKCQPNFPKALLWIIKKTIMNAASFNVNLAHEIGFENSRELCVLFSPEGLRLFIGGPDSNTDTTILAIIDGTWINETKGSQEEPGKKIILIIPLVLQISIPMAVIWQQPQRPTEYD